MGEPFIGGEAVRAGRLTPYALRSRYRAVLPGIYLPPGAEITAITRAKAGWLWTGRAGVGTRISAVPRCFLWQSSPTLGLSAPRLRDMPTPPATQAP